MHLSVFLGQRNDEDNLEEVKSFFRLKRSEELKSGHIKEILFPRLKLNRNFTNIGLRWSVCTRYNSGRQRRNSRRIWYKGLQVRGEFQCNAWVYPLETTELMINS